MTFDSGIRLGLECLSIGAGVEGARSCFGLTHFEVPIMVSEVEVEAVTIAGSSVEEQASASALDRVGTTIDLRWHFVD